MSPTFSSKNNVRYRFYISTALRGRKSAAGSVKRISAPEIEDIVEAELRRKLNAGDTETTLQQLVAHIQRVVVSADKIQITLGDTSKSKRPIEIPWKPVPKDRVQIRLAPSETKADPKLLKAMVRAKVWLHQLSNGQHESIGDLAAAAGYNAKVIRQGLRLAFLAPEITSGTLHGSTPVSLTQIPKLLPLSWQEQLQSIG